MPPVPETEDGLDPKIQKLIQIQIEKVRKEFELQLQQERLERMKLEMEIQELKNQLQ
jgi:hypothetical protein